MGQAVYPEAKELMIMADGGGSNGSRVRLWKLELKRLVNELDLTIRVCHFPPGTSKWNKIEHRLFSFSSPNWRGQPLVSHEVTINLIAATTTRKGLKVRAEIDSAKYQTGIKVIDAEFAKIRIDRDDFQGEWTYVISPNRQRYMSFPYGSIWLYGLAHWSDSSMTIAYDQWNYSQECRKF